MNHPIRSRQGFTLVETLVALALISAVMLPASFWLYRSRTSEAAWERFRAVQVLEMKMNRALLERWEKDRSEEIPGPGYLRLQIRVVQDGAETKLLGSASDRKGRPITSLEAAYFLEKLP